MTKKEIEEVLNKILDREAEPLDIPSSRDWDYLSNKFNCTFSDEFKFFIELISEYSFPGEIYNVSTGKTNGNDSIEIVYDFEMKEGNWNPDLIPFYGVGNGDYFCLNAKESSNSPVYYYYHEDFRAENYSEDFADWIKALPDYLG